MTFKLLLITILSFLFFVRASAQKRPVTAPAKKAASATQAKKPVAKTVVASKGVSKVPVQSKERLIEITTDFGAMVAKLYDSTPLHRDNFVKLVEQQFYDSLLFHRVIQNFMIQGGDPTSKYATDSTILGLGSAPGNRIPAEFKPYLIHKKGALAAARDNNAAKASSNSQFYIVHGKKYTQQELEGVYNQRVVASNSAFKYTTSQKEIYERLGGTPQLDQSYTVFGEVISGLDVIDKIAAVAKGVSDRPVVNIRMKIRLLN